MQNVNIVREYVRKNFVDKGMCADIAIHDSGTGNPHAHIMLTMRPFDDDRTWGAKQRKAYILDENGEKIYDTKKRQYRCDKVETTDWNDKNKAEEWRGAWADITNVYLEQLNIATRLDHRSYERQGIEQIPTIHLGVAAHQMEKRGIKTDRGNINREIMVSNSLLRQLGARITKLQKWIDEESKNDEPPMLADVISDILNRRNKDGQANRYQTLNNLQAASKMLNFLTEYSIMDLDGLHKFVISMHSKQSVIREKLKPVERRLKTLDVHIKQAGYLNRANEGRDRVYTVMTE